MAGEASSGSDATMMTGKLVKGGCGQRSGRRRVSRVMIAAGGRCEDDDDDAVMTSKCKGDDKAR